MTTVARMCPLTTVSLADMAARIMQFRKFDQRSEDWVNTNPPIELTATLLAREGQWHVPGVAGRDHHADAPSRRVVTIGRWLRSGDSPVPGSGSWFQHAGGGRSIQPETMPSTPWRISSSCSSAFPSSTRLTGLLRWPASLPLPCEVSFRRRRSVRSGRIAQAPVRASSST